MVPLLISGPSGRGTSIANTSFLACSPSGLWLVLCGRLPTFNTTAFQSSIRNRSELRKPYLTSRATGLAFVYIPFPQINHIHDFHDLHTALTDLRFGCSFPSDSRNVRFVHLQIQLAKLLGATEFQAAFSTSTPENGSVWDGSLHTTSACNQFISRLYACHIIVFAPRLDQQSRSGNMHCTRKDVPFSLEKNHSW